MGKTLKWCDVVSLSLTAATAVAVCRLRFPFLGFAKMYRGSRDKFNPILRCVPNEEKEEEKERESERLFSFEMRAPKSIFFYCLFALACYLFKEITAIQKHKYLFERCRFCSPSICLVI